MLSASLWKVEHKKSDGSLLIGYEYSYDPLGRVVQSVERPSGDVTSYAYTPAGRLESEGRTGQVAYSRTYAYNPDGSRDFVIRDDAVNGSHWDFYSYDAVSGRLESVLDVWTGEVNSFVWNPEGTLARWENNQLNSYARVFGYDEEGRLLRIERDYGGGTLQLAYAYGYNSDGVRVWKREHAGDVHFEYRFMCGSRCVGVPVCLYSREIHDGWIGTWQRGEEYTITPSAVFYNQFVHFPTTAGHLIFRSDNDALIWVYHQDLYGVPLAIVMPTCIQKRDRDGGCLPFYLGEDPESSCNVMPLYGISLLQKNNSRKIPELPEEWQKCLENAWKKYCDTDKTSLWQLRCIIWAESCDDPNAKNPRTGASGLMQIHPCWFRTPRPPKKKQGFHCTDIIDDFNVFDPCDNITCGVYLFCRVHGSDPKKYGTGETRKYKNCMSQKPQ